MRSKNPLRVTLLAGSLLATLGVLFFPTDEKRVKAAAEALVTAANGSDAEFVRALQTYASPEVSISVADLPEAITGREALASAVRQSSALGVRPHFHVESVQVSLEGRVARVNADVVGSVRPEVPELRRPRHSVATFEKQGDGFRLVSAEIGPETRDQPEARP